MRLIAGKWRGRKVAFFAAPGLRPTPDRVRETLFNWLAPIIEGANCLDLFAGSGALGIEALSRGARRVTLVENNSAVAECLQSQLQLLGADNAEVVRAEARHYLAGTAQCFDIVFLDPPYQSHFVQPCIDRLAMGGWLVPGAWVYFETARDETPPDLPPGWVVQRHKTAGQVAYYLVRSDAPA
ncbi:MAG: 16S rRNA (guanine(966)-N(2))-methyltransferase RsmD [Pseudomonadota bacterium]|nr:MAG: 16S rRNA (guanine(966)-N(2))-methyltransferase RsmD [Pseudomonadota bacterium]